MSSSLISVLIEAQCDNNLLIFGLKMDDGYIGLGLGFVKV